MSKSLLHSSTSKICNGVRNLRMPTSRSPSYTAPKQEELDYAETSKKSQLSMQEIEVVGMGEGKKKCVAFFDSGSNINLVRRAFAECLGIPATAVTQQLKVMGNNPEEWQTFAYKTRKSRGAGISTM